MMILIWSMGLFSGLIGAKAGWASPKEHFAQSSKRVLSYCGRLSADGNNSTQL